MVKSVRTVLGLTMVLGALAACDDNPMKDNRDQGEYIFTNPSFSTIVAGDTVQVVAQVRNQYLAPTGDAVTATPCDSKITAAVDTTRTEFEAPERFWVRAVSLGSSCLIVSGGGVTDTVNFLVGPSAITVVAASPLGSGVTAPITVTFQNMQGQPVTGLTIADVVLASSAPGTVFVDNAAQTMTGRAPGTANVTATLLPGRGQATVGTTPVTVVAGPFTGTFSPATLVQGGLMTLTAGAIPFDADTKVIVGTDSALVVTQTATTITAVVPAVAASPATVVISNLGPNQVASTFTAPVAAEAGEPDAFGATARPATIGANQYGVLTATDSEDWFRYDVTAASQLVTVNLRWPGVTGVAANDLDVLIFNAAHTQLSTTGNCESAALPETCSRTLTTGTYYFQVLRFNGTSSQPYRLLVN